MESNWKEVLNFVATSERKASRVARLLGFIEQAGPFQSQGNAISSCGYKNKLVLRPLTGGIRRV